MTEPDIKWYWDATMMNPEGGFVWSRNSSTYPIFTVKCKTWNNRSWHVCRVEFDINTTKDQIDQAMNTLLDVCRMRYADELLNEGEMK